MSHSASRRVVVDLVPGSNPLRGTIHNGHDERSFTGWMQLTAHLEGASRDTGLDVTVRDAQVGDAEAIAAIGRVGFPAVHSGHVPDDVVAAIVSQLYDLDSLRACIDACHEHSDREFLVAERDGQVRGFVHYEGDHETPELMRIYVDRDELRSGLGRSLVEALEARLSPGSSYILLVLAANERARRFYERLGFVEERVVDGPAFFAEHMEIALPPRDRPADACVMRRTLPG